MVKYLLFVIVTYNLNIYCSWLYKPNSFYYGRMHTTLNKISFSDLYNFETVQNSN